MFYAELLEIKERIKAARKRLRKQEESRRRLEAETIYANVSERKAEIQERIESGAVSNYRLGLISSLLGMALFFLCGGSLVFYGVWPACKLYMQGMVSPYKDLKASSIEYPEAERFLSFFLYGGSMAGSYHRRIWSPKANEAEISRCSIILEQLKGASFNMDSLKLLKGSPYSLAVCDFGGKGRHCFLLEREGGGELRLLCIDFEE